MERLAGRIILLWGWRRLAVAFAAGALLVLTQAPYDFFAAGFVAFPVLVWLLDGATAEVSSNPLRRLKPAFAIGWWFGFGYFLAGLWWIGGALLVEAESFAWALPFAVLGIPLLLAFFYGFATAGRPHLLGQRHRPHRGARLRFRSGGMAARLPVHRLSVESGRAGGDADAASDAERCGDERDRHERARGLRLRDAGAARGQAQPAPRADPRAGSHRRACRLRLHPAERAAGSFDGNPCRPHRSAVDRPVGKMGRQRARSRLPDDDGPICAAPPKQASLRLG